MKITISINGEEFALAEDEEHSEEGEHAGDEEHAAEGPPNPVLPEPNHILWALGSFLVLWALMHFVLLPPLLKSRAEREEKMKSDREAADKAQAALHQVQADYDAALASARAEADGIIDAARAEAGEHRAAVLAEANTEVADMRAAAGGQLDQSRSAALASMRGDVGDIAVAAASAVLGKDLDRGAQQGAIDSALSGGDA